LFFSENYGWTTHELFATVFPSFVVTANGHGGYSERNRIYKCTSVK
jgi:hypothetical protein